MKNRVINTSSHKPTIFAFLKIYIEEHFPHFIVTYDETALFIEGRLQDPDWKNSYRFLINTTLSSAPKAYIFEPEIVPNRNIHMYADQSLCLYHPNDMLYKYNFRLVDDIIPWLIKWVHFYEIWLRNGNIWIGPEAPHN